MKIDEHTIAQQSTRSTQRQIDRVSRLKAQSLGQLDYISIRPCPKGHIGARRCKTMQCKICFVACNLAWYIRTHPGYTPRAPKENKIIRVTKKAPVTPKEIVSNRVQYEIELFGSPIHVIYRKLKF